MATKLGTLFQRHGDDIRAILAAIAFVGGSALYVEVVRVRFKATLAENRARHEEQMAEERARHEGPLSQLSGQLAEERALRETDVERARWEVAEKFLKLGYVEEYRRFEQEFGPRKQDGGKS